MLNENCGSNIFSLLVLTLLRHLQWLQRALTPYFPMKGFFTKYLRSVQRYNKYNGVSIFFAVTVCYLIPSFIFATIPVVYVIRYYCRVLTCTSFAQIFFEILHSISPVASIYFRLSLTCCYLKQLLSGRSFVGGNYQ